MPQPCLGGQLAPCGWPGAPSGTRRRVSSTPHAPPRRFHARMSLPTPLMQAPTLRSTVPTPARCYVALASRAASWSGLSTNLPRRHCARAPTSARPARFRRGKERISTLFALLFRWVRRQICRQRRRHICRQISGRGAGFLRTCLHSWSSL